jgi:hypothetical protein
MLAIWKPLHYKLIKLKLKNQVENIFSFLKKSQNENLKLINSIYISKLIFPKVIFIHMFLKGLNHKHMNLDMEKNVNFNMI